MDGLLLVRVMGLALVLGTLAGCGTRSASEISETRAAESASSADDVPSPQESLQLAAGENPPTQVEPAVFLVDEGLEHSVLISSRVETQPTNPVRAVDQPADAESSVVPASFEAD